MRSKVIRRLMVRAHRWAALVLGLALVVESTCGAVALYQSEWFLATHSGFYRHTDSDHQISAQDATAYGVDPGTGRINGLADIDGGVMGFIVNLHICALACPHYPGYISALADLAPILGLTWGAAILAGLGLLMLALAITGVLAWWPGIRRLWRRTRVRWSAGRFARDYDLHNLIGIVALPFLLMWGVTGAAFELPVVANAWLAVTGGHWR
ncbi:MAG TPA: PepSY-associated TM helix domain-containing protein [Pseudonocardiaceae bacterium]|nr:PepSY-associated TM helix domain-containing protein [Pseudonocardiaceae bacterium]